MLCCGQIEPKSLTLGEVLDGDRMALSLYEVHFRGLQAWDFLSSHVQNVFFSEFINLLLAHLCIFVQN